MAEPQARAHPSAPLAPQPVPQPVPLVAAEAYARLEDLPAEAEQLFAAAPFQGSRAWWHCVCRAALPEGAAGRFVLCRDGAGPLALFPLCIDPAGRLGSLSTPYTTEWAPLLRPGLDGGTLAGIGSALGRLCRPWPVMRWEALDARWPPLRALLRGLRAAGMRAVPYDHFGNWQEDTAGLDWPGYLARRPGALRQTIRRRMARAARNPALRFTLARTPDQLAPALAAYRDVYRRSWKPPEPYEAFDAALLSAAAAMGVLRLGVLWQAGTAVAAQYWIVADGQATILKLAHDEAHRALSPGTLLTAWMVRLLLDGERVGTLDFGRGDDPYKRLWTSRRRQRVGLVLANPWRPDGACALARQQLGRLRRMVRHRFAPAREGVVAHSI